MQDTEDLLTNELELTEALKNNLIDTAKWSKFLSVIGLIFCALMLAASFYAGFYVSRIMAKRYGFSIGPAISAVYFFFAVVWFFPCVFLYRFSVKLQESIKNNVQENIESAFLNLRSVFKFLGIVVILILFLWMVAFLLLVVANL